MLKPRRNRAAARRAHRQPLERGDAAAQPDFKRLAQREHIVVRRRAEAGLRPSQRHKLTIPPPPERAFGQRRSRITPVPKRRLRRELERVQRAARLDGQRADPGAVTAGQSPVDHGVEPLAAVQIAQRHSRRAGGETSIIDAQTIGGQPDPKRLRAAFRGGGQFAAQCAGKR